MTNVAIRTDEGGYATVRTTFGSVTFPVFTYWEYRAGARVQRSPGKDALFPFHRNCRSSVLCLEWECALGTDHPFRSAQQALAFFTRGAVTLEDNAIGAHAVTVGGMLESDWLYKKPEDIREILMTRATRDAETGQPLLYFSTDAHALRLYTDDTWKWNWKMTNGLRLWCKDAKTGKILHLGGEYLWGGIEAAAKGVRHLIAQGILPDASEPWQSVNARLVFVSDASNAIADHILPLLPAATAILDPFHVVGWFAELSREVYRGKGKERKAQALYRRAWEIILGTNRPPRKQAVNVQKRRGHRKNRSGTPTQAVKPSTASGENNRRGPGDIAQELLALLGEVAPRSDAGRAACKVLENRLKKNAPRMDYDRYSGCGIDIGSGAMESLHKSGSQLRLKLPGARWLPETSGAMLRLRMLQLSGRWDEFWRQEELTTALVSPFEKRSAQRREDRQVWEANRRATKAAA